MVIESAKHVASPLVSILVPTYNQENYIVQCLDSILSQQCNFNFEIVIGEDCGTDGTRQLCLEYQQKYPEKIKVLFQETNKGIVENFIDITNLCKGEYIAVCAGDDYWCDKLKLQKQVIFLANHSEYGFVRTDFYKLTGQKLVDGNGYYNGVGNVFEYAQFGPCGQASTICFRSELLKHINFDEFIARKFSMEDYPLHAILAKHTLFGYISDKTTVYRQLENSLGNPKLKNKNALLKYAEGYSSVRNYLAELYPEDITWWNGDIARNYMLHQHLRIAFNEFEFKTAQKYAGQMHNPNNSETRLIHFTKNRILFYSACIFKKIKG